MLFISSIVKVLKILNYNTVTIVLTCSNNSPPTRDGVKFYRDFCIQTAIDNSYTQFFFQSLPFGS
jgi:hypothetical protein